MPQRRESDDHVLPRVFREGPPAWKSRRRPDPTSVANARFPAAVGAAGGMRLWILSDLAVGRDDDGFVLPDPLPRFDAMLVAGNVADDLAASLEWLAAALNDRLRGRPVILVPGTRDYRSELPPSETLRRAREKGSGLGIVVLADEAIRLPDGRGAAVHVIGATLWTDWSLNGAVHGQATRGYARHGWTGARGILAEDGRPWGPHDAAGAHARSRAFIEDALGNAVCQRLGFGTSPTALVSGVGPGDRVVVMTHHAPSPFSLPPDWEGWCGDPWLAASYATDLEDVMDAWGAPALWVHGCVPAAVDFRLGKTRVVANPRPRDDRGQAFDPAFVVEV